MKRIIYRMFIVSFSYSFAQTSIEGSIYGKSPNESLPFATIKIISNRNYYTITNEDGKFEINNRFANDSIEVRFLGFKTQKVPLSYFKENSKLYLTPNVTSLNTVLVVAEKKKDYTYELLYSLIEKYRKLKETTSGKAFLTLTSSARGVPIEIVEGFYSSKQSLAGGIEDLQIKAGRFGQNRNFPFYSLNNTDILKDFKLFQKTGQILPSYPGNMSLSTIKSKYIVTIDDCPTCGKGDLSISFKPKKAHGNLFSGVIIFNKEALKIKKIEINNSNPITNGLTAIVEKDEMKPKEITLVINFNPIDESKIQSVNFDFSMFYISGERMEIISSNSFLYFYDYNNPFEQPFFTTTIKFNNDYDKIIALQSSEDFWESNYQFPASFNEKRSIQFFKESGYLINYDNSVPSDYIKYIRPSVIIWTEEQPLTWNNIKYAISSNNPIKEIDHSDNQGPTKEVDKESFSISDLRIKKKTINDEKFNFNYVLDSYLYKNQWVFNSKTIFDRNNSFCTDDRSQNKLMYVNQIFNIYEIFNQRLSTELNTTITLDKAIKLCESYYEEANETVEKMNLETEKGANFQQLIKWNETVNEKLNELQQKTTN